MANAKPSPPPTRVIRPRGNVVAVDRAIEQLAADLIGKRLTPMQRARLFALLEIH